MKLLTLLLAFTVFFSCKDTNRFSYSKKNVATAKDIQLDEGKKLMENKCYVCHNPKTSEKDRIAPPMVAIKKHYISEKTSKEEFINSMQKWIKNPIEENAKMRGAVRRFGVMPKQYFSEEDIKQISEYMFDHKIEKPAWFEEHFNKERGNGKGNGMHKQHQGNNFKDLPYNERGLKYALSTKAVLGKNLMGKIQKEGTLAALKFCNIRAYPLTDSMSVVYNATIKRISDKPRNPKNLANTIEKGYIKIFKKDVNNNKESNPIVVETSEKINFYYPIKTNSMCLQCHGKPTSDIKPNMLAQINNLYPKDLAIGYSENEIRGIWNVSFSK